MTVNVDLLTRTLDHIEQHPDQWDQGVWAVQYIGPYLCTTAYCFAGWAIQLAGHTISFDPLKNYYGENLVEYIGDEPISRIAQRELGLNTEQAERLFCGDNTLTELRSTINKYVNEALHTNEPVLAA